IAWRGFRDADMQESDESIVRVEAEAPCSSLKIGDASSAEVAPHLIGGRRKVHVLDRTKYRPRFFDFGDRPIGVSFHEDGDDMGREQWFRLQIVIPRLFK